MFLASHVHVAERNRGYIKGDTYTSVVFFQIFHCAKLVPKYVLFDSIKCALKKKKVNDVKSDRLFVKLFEASF